MRSVIPPPKYPSSGIEFITFCEAIRARIPPTRLRHVLGVSRAAEKLAARHGASTYRARIAGIAHDVARHWQPGELLAYARRNGMSVSPVELAAPLLLHARVGAEVARREFGIDDPEILSAIASHTIARPNMSLLDKCVYLADSIEPSRTFADRAALAALADADLDEAFGASVQSSIRHLMAAGVPIAPETIEVYDQMVQQHGK